MDNGSTRVESVGAFKINQNSLRPDEVCPICGVAIDDDDPLNKRVIAVQSIYFGGAWAHDQCEIWLTRVICHLDSYFAFKAGDEENPLLNAHIIARVARFVGGSSHAPGYCATLEINAVARLVSDLRHVFALYGDEQGRQKRISIPPLTDHVV